MKVEIKSFGSYNGVNYSEIFVTNKNNHTISFCDLGARINRWLVPAKDKKVSVVLGHDNAESAFYGQGYYYGATVGRVAGRIAGGLANFKGSKLNLGANDGGNCLHGGKDAFDVKKWDYEIIKEVDKVKVSFTYTDPAGYNNFPGELKVKVIHSFDNDNTWKIEYFAKSDEDTLFNPTNHVYFNLNGSVEEDITNHTLEVDSTYYLPLDDSSIPLGHLEKVEETAFDLRKGELLKDVLIKEDEQLVKMKGLDHPFKLDHTKEELITLSTPERKLIVKSDRPYVILYSQNYTDPKIKIWGKELKKHSGLAIELQEAPDAINQPDLGSVILEANKDFYSFTSYQIKE